MNYVTHLMCWNYLRHSRLTQDSAAFTLLDSAAFTLLDFHAFTLLDSAAFSSLDSAAFTLLDSAKDGHRWPWLAMANPGQVPRFGFLKV